MKEDSTAQWMDPQNLLVRRSSVTTSPQTTNVDYIEVFVVYFLRGEVGLGIYSSWTQKISKIIAHQKSQ